MADLRRLGFDCVQGGPVDLLVWHRGERWVVALEVKGKHGSMTALQTDLLARGFPMAIVRDLNETLAAIDAARRE